ncbi:MAG: hypothetical protein R3322_19705 [Kiloniellales bacterium]|jgi:hypothetical protein|nr:hypothetical protein [Kiloniellales bacterium]
MSDLNRKYAWSNIKSAIRSYAKDPTAQHAKQVEEAWKEIRKMETPSHWPEWRAARFDAPDPPGRSGQAR